jgi:hypothetical protein
MPNGNAAKLDESARRRKAPSAISGSSSGA